MRPRRFVLIILASYCLLSTMCLGGLILFWGGFLEEQEAASCREKALQAAPPVMADSGRVYEEDDGDDANPGRQVYGYTTAAAFEAVVATYTSDDEYCVLLDDDLSARCMLPGTDEFQYAVEIKVGDAQTLYQIIIDWHCPSEN